MGSKIEVSEYKFKNERHASCICITKRTPKYIHLHIKIYHGYLYSLYDVKVKKKYT